ncbi:MAG: hypothetical protein Q9174_003521 [Haloplaca sp. 1 TL-2023]
MAVGATMGVDEDEKIPAFIGDDEQLSLPEMGATMQDHTVSFGLINGGLAGLVWMFVVAAFGMGTTVLSLADMASMAPTSGGQYHWTSELASPKAQKLLSFMTGERAVELALAWTK